MKNRYYSFFCLFIGLSLGLNAQTGIPVPGMSNCDTEVSNFLAQYSIPSATVAIAKDGELKYMRAFGNADLAGNEATQPYHLFRIASVSKPITGIAIMKMVEDGHLNLSDKVFGSNGLLASHPYLSTVSVSDNRIYDITVQHLLEHSGGWNRDVDCIAGANPPYAWSINHCDPIGFPLYVTQLYGESNPVKEEVLIRFLMEKGVEFTPGTQYAYSNIGYLALGLVIEQVSGKTYEEYVKSEVLDPIGAYDMYIGKNLLTDKREREGEYVGNGYNAPSVYGTGQNVPWEYGGWSLEAMDAHGGWIATARDLVRLLVAVDGFSTKADILSQSSISTMVSPSANNGGYAKGWSVNQFNNWWHTGALDGTASIWVRSSGGYTWAVILNKRVINNQANSFWTAFDNLCWSCVTNASSFPSWDLLDFPDQNASNLNLVSNGPGSVDLSWSNGNGASRIVIGREGAPIEAFPLDGMDYQASSTWAQGDELGQQHFVVYNGTADNVNITGLDSTKTYHFRVFEYNQNTNTGQNTLYQLARSPQESIDLSGTTNIEDLAALGVRFYPNPAQDQLFLEIENPQQIDRVEIVNLQGQSLLQVEISQQKQVLDLQQLSSGLYAITFSKRGHYIGSERFFKR